VVDFHLTSTTVLFYSIFSTEISEVGKFYSPIKGALSQEFAVSASFVAEIFTWYLKRNQTTGGSESKP